MSKLKEVLGQEAYDELQTMLTPAADSNSLKVWLKGAVKSWTAWAGAVLVAAPEILPQLAPHFQELMTPDRYHRLLQIVGIAMILLRVKTSKSLSEKGAS